MTEQEPKPAEPSAPHLSAPEPRGLAVAALPAVLLGVALLGIGGVCVRELMLFAGWFDGPRWLENSAGWVAQLQFQGWMRFAAPAAVLAGLLLILAAVKPRSRTHGRVRADTDIWLRPTDIARLCSAAAFACTEVLTASTSVGRKDVVVSVTAPDEDGVGFDELTARVRDHVTAVLSELEQPLTVRVNVLPGTAHTPDQRRRVI